MKIIGMGERGDEYIAIVSHTELEKCADKYYGNLKPLKVGSEFNVGAGYDFASKIKEACKEMHDAMKAFERAQETMTKFAIMVSELPDSEDAA